jgi:ketosteroid isomerase-like protein
MADNAGLVREVYEAWSRGDIDLIVAACDPEIEIVQPPEVPDSKSYRGHPGVVESFEDWPSQWDSFAVTLHEIIEIGDRQVISVHTQHLSARGAAFDQELAFLHTFEGEKMTRVDMFLSVEAAREAAERGD